MPEQIVTPLEKLEALGSFEGKRVLGSGVKCNLGGGLKDALAVDPVKLKIGERMYLVVEGEVTDVQHPTVKDTDGVRRNHVLEVKGAAIVDKGAVEQMLEESARLIEEAKGVQRLDFDGEEAQAMVAEHDDGQHASGLREGCPKCAEEQALAASGD